MKEAIWKLILIFLGFVSGFYGGRRIFIEKMERNGGKGGWLLKLARLN